MSSESEGDETTKKLVGTELNSAAMLFKVVMDGNVSGLRELLETSYNTSYTYIIHTIMLGERER